MVESTGVLWFSALYDLYDDVWLQCVWKGVALFYFVICFFRWCDGRKVMVITTVVFDYRSTLSTHVLCFYQYK